MLKWVKLPTPLKRLKWLKGVELHTSLEMFEMDFPKKSDLFEMG